MAANLELATLHWHQGICFHFLAFISILLPRDCRLSSTLPRITGKNESKVAKGFYFLHFHLEKGLMDPPTYPLSHRSLLKENGLKMII